MASDIFGVSGRAMLAALIAGERDPKRLAQLARARLRAKLSLLEEAFTGFFTDQHAFLLAKMLARVDQLDADLAELDAKIQELIAGFAGAVDRLDEIPGLGQVAARRQPRRAGNGHDPVPDRWAAGVVGQVRPRRQGVRGNPGQRLDRARQPVSGSGARRGCRGRRQDRYLPGGTLPADRLPPRCQAGIVAVGRSILVIVWHLLADPTLRFQDLGAGLLRHPHQR